MVAPLFAIAFCITGLQVSRDPGKEAVAGKPTDVTDEFAR